MEFWIIEGGANVGKTSVTRCLSGAWREGIWNVEIVQGGLSSSHAVYIYTGSPNERNPPPSPQKLESDLMNSRADKVLLSLRSKRMSKGQIFDAISYYRHFVNGGHTILGTASFGPTPATLPGAVRFGASKTDPSNKTAANLRQQWGWI